MSLLEIVPALIEHAPAPDPDARVVVHVGSQELRIPARKIVALLIEAIDGVEAWSKTGSGPLVVAYGMLKVPANFLMPFLPKMLSDAIKLPFEFPKKPRHTDPILWVLRLIVATIAPYLVSGKWTVTVDDDGQIAEAHVDLADLYRVVLYQPSLAEGDELVAQGANA